MLYEIIIPSSCQVIVVAEMKKRGISPCDPAPGADGSCDNIRVNVLGGTRPFISGISNADIKDELTVTGPATLVVERHANRADEIITYTVTNIDPSCPSCSVVLPIRLLDFEGEQYDAKSNALKWTIGTEINNHYFRLERSMDTVAAHFETIAIVEGAGNSDSKREYTIIDQLPSENANTYYYRLSQTDFDGKTEFFNPISIKREVFISTYFSEKELHVLSNESYDLKIIDVTGKLLLNQSALENETTDLSELPQGVYIYNVSVNGQNIIKKLVID